ncbi:MAG: carboxypeptidase-like regulatory domain-containing protein, partial [Thermanaerothrix sp.]|nr:carboxypeptidase-like regulatory domain-containing protein [Thermanaerothrix sp.]
ALTGGGYTLTGGFWNGTAVSLPYIRVSPESAQPGATVTVEGRGHAGYNNANIMMPLFGPLGALWRLKSIPLRPDGTFETQVTIPQNASPGTSALYLVSTKGMATSPPVGTSFAVLPSPPGAIAGRVTSDSNPVPGTQVEARGPTTVTTSTDSSGNYAIQNLPPGLYDVRAYKNGYEVPPAKSIAVNSGRTTELNFNLRATTAPGPAVVRVWAKYNGLQGNNIGTFVSLQNLGIPVNNIFYAEIAQGAGAARVTFTLYNQTKEAQTVADGWSAQFDMSSLPPGTHSLVVRAYDSQGREGPSHTATVHI